jgi:hypothetical protein
MVDEDYEIISHKEIDRLKQEINKLKEAEFSGSANTIMDKLDKILDIFKEASQNMQNDKSSDKQLDSINYKLDNILDQNQKIAEGVLAVADMINNATEEEKSEIPEKAPKPMPPEPNPMSPPNMMPPRPNPMYLRSGPIPHDFSERPSLNPPSFPKPGFFSSENQGKPSIQGLPPLPPKPKKGLFR